jgi:hypothetical protein
MNERVEFILDMKLYQHKYLLDVNWNVLRVVGGWIYSKDNGPAVFVPITNDSVLDGASL